MPSYQKGDIFSTGGYFQNKRLAIIKHKVAGLQKASVIKIIPPCPGIRQEKSNKHD